MQRIEKNFAMARPRRFYLSTLSLASPASGRGVVVLIERIAWIGMRPLLIKKYFHRTGKFSITKTAFAINILRAFTAIHMAARYKCSVFCLIKAYLALFVVVIVIIIVML